MTPGTGATGPSTVDNGAATPATDSRPDPAAIGAGDGSGAVAATVLWLFAPEGPDGAGGRSITTVPVFASVTSSTAALVLVVAGSAALASVTRVSDRAPMAPAGRLVPVTSSAMVAMDCFRVTEDVVATRSGGFFLCSRSTGASESGGTDVSSSAELSSTSRTNADGAAAASDSSADLLSDCSPDESEDDRLRDQLRLVNRVSDASAFVVERFPPTEVFDPLPEAVELPVDFESASLADDVLADADEPEEELAEPD